MPLELIIGAAIGAGVCSTRVRNSVRTGLVYGLAGVLKAYDKVAAVATDIRSSARGNDKPEADQPAPTPAARTAEPPAKEPSANTSATPAHV